MCDNIKKEYVSIIIYKRKNKYTEMKDANYILSDNNVLPQNYFKKL